MNARKRHQKHVNWHVRHSDGMKSTANTSPSRNIQMKGQSSAGQAHTLSYSGVKLGSDPEVPFIDYAHNPFLAYNFKN